MDMKTILVSTDFSDDSERALEIAVDLARLGGGRIVLLHAYTTDLPLGLAAYGGGLKLPDDFHARYQQQAKEQVESVASRTASEQGVEVEGVAVHQPAFAAILEQAESLPASLIVMGTRGRTGLDRVMLGSTAERVVRMAACPVLTAKAR